MSPEDFISTIKGAALACQKEEGIPASFTIAQAALESAWGESQLTRAANNLFGIKADASWTGERYRIATAEYVAGQKETINAWFRQYANWQESILDHARFLKGARYAGAFKTGSGITFGYAIASAGYATDSNYGTKIARVIHTHGLESLDAMSEPVNVLSPPQENSMQKLLALWSVFKVGESVADPALWKTGAITVTLLSPLILKLEDLFHALGWAISISDQQAGMLAGGIVAATNIVVHLVANKDMGLK
ncbi:glycoside hydrolase family 73 protein [Ferrovum myxofaciens]|uniref:glycoside hydrolase family 73 protein n=1 Tax=Ferrovum myxofaciens TaxID=416213 RepID=UPI0023574461|nr:glucosaminidase domain-containing protein [Ferrovum myxofaciens]